MNQQEKTVKGRISFLNRLMKKWGLKSLFQVVIILIVFSITGMTVVLVRPLVFNLLNYNAQTPFWIKTVTYILLIFPMYQVLILVYGALLGQFSFFWNKEKKLFSALARPFKSKKNNQQN